MREFLLTLEELYQLFPSIIILYLNLKENKEKAFSVGLIDCQAPCISMVDRSNQNLGLKKGKDGENFYPMNNNTPKTLKNLEIFITNIIQGKVRGGMPLEF